jgi:integrase/recombinase XerD
MSSAKIVMRMNKSKDGSYPMTIRITKDRKTSYIYLGHNLQSNEWDAVKQQVKKSHPNAARLNNLFAKRLLEANDKLLEMEAQRTDTSSATIRRSIESKKNGTFFKQAAVYLDDLKKNGKFNRFSADSPRIKRFREFLQNGDIALSEITPALLKKFKTFLKSTRNITERTAVNHLVVIRTIFNQAIAANVVDSKHYPFGKGKIVIKFPDSIKMGLVESEVRAIEELDLPVGSPLNHARNIWLFSFYFAGMRVSDVLRLKWSDFQNDRLHYSMGKNYKAGSLKVPEKALRIIDQYRRENPVHNLVFPDLETLPNLDSLYDIQSRTTQKVKKINDSLQEVATLIGIDKKLTMHIARHTFGNISGDRIPIQMLQKLYRHTSITTTIGYQANFIHKDADTALDAVINFEG